MSLVTFGEKIALDKIEAAFQNFWRETSDAGSSEAVLKAATLNLIIILDDKTLYDELLAGLQQIIADHPGRIVIVYLNPESDLTDIEAHISAYSQKTKEQTQISAEVVILETSHAGSTHLAGTILPLLLPDLPVYLWCPSYAALMNPHVRILFQFIDRLIVSTPSEYDSPQQMAAMIDTLLALDRECKISDMSWSRLTDWREAVAQFFDVQENLKYLGLLDEVEITCAGDKLSNDALLMAGWMASSLKSAAHAAAIQDDSTIYFGRHQLSIKIRKKSINGRSGIRKIKLYAEEDEKAVIFTAMAIPDECIQTILQKGGSQVTRYLYCKGQKKNIELLCAELDFLQQDQIYLNTCRIISEHLHENNS
ncbi:glucose-6-phosphate dehydrogenase assembly protein OpcA [candidate division KSB1 bacterium]|nr:glucose-6-phosphate dehydrogenase assembly protein OpcA [candidate division KSB1 bacterium]